MEKVKDIIINEGITHVLDVNTNEPILNDYLLNLNEKTYNFLLKHIEKIFKNTNIKYAKFKQDTPGEIKKLSQEYLNGKISIKNLSLILAKKMFSILKNSTSNMSSDLIIVSISTEHGNMLGILVMDYRTNYTHNINVIDEKTNIDIIETHNLPKTIQKGAFIKTINNSNYDLIVLDKIKKIKKDDYEAHWFTHDYLECDFIRSSTDKTKELLNLTEKWTRKNLINNAATAESIRSSLRKELKEKKEINIEELANKVIQEENFREDLKEYLYENKLEDNIQLDEELVEKNLNKIRLTIESDIELTLNEKIYNDNNRFEIQKQEDGSVNIVIKDVYNYIEKL